MKPSVPNWLFLGGAGAIGLSNTCKELAPDSLGRIFWLHWGCAIISALLFSLGLLLSALGLFSEKAPRRQFLLPFLCNLTFLTGLPVLYFTSYVIFTKIYHLPDSFPSLLPKLVENARVNDAETKRIKSAQLAYTLYGVRIAYRREDGQFEPYVPTAQDTGAFMRQRDIDRNILLSKQRLKGSIDQWPYLFGFYMGALFLTFFFGSLWMVFIKPKTERVLQS